MRSHGLRGIASGAKIRFARCRLHPRASPPTYLRSAGSIRVTPLPSPTYHPIARPLWPRYRSTLVATLLPRASKARTSTALWSCRQLPSSTLHRRPNSIPYGPQALQLNHPSSPCLAALSLSLSIFFSFSVQQTFRFVSFPSPMNFLAEHLLLGALLLRFLPLLAWFGTKRGLKWVSEIS